MPGGGVGTANFTKAQIKIETGDTIKCWLNPTEIAITKANSWEAKGSPGSSMGTPQFKGGQPMSLNLKLLFDKSVADGDTVKGVVDKLFKAMEATISVPAPPRQGSSGSGGGTGGSGGSGGGGQANRNTKRPPTMEFSWGGLMQPFTANCKQLQVTYNLFDPTGEPTRATVTLGLEQAAPSTAAGAPTNPTTRAMQGLGSHRLRDGDSLPSLAYHYYGDATDWRRIARANDIDNPMKLRSGDELFIPRID